MAEEQAQTLQPDEVVTTESEATPESEDSSQSVEDGATESEELVLDAEGFQDKKPKFDHETPEWKAFRKEKDAKRRKQAMIDEMRERERKQQEELQELREQVSQVARGNKPTLESCDYDEKAFEQALDKWKSHSVKAHSPNNEVAASQPSEVNQQQSAAPEIGLDDHTEYAHFQNEQSLKKSFTDYGDTVEQFKESFYETVQRFLSAEVPKESAVNAMINVGSTAGVDVAKAMYALEKIPQLKSELFQPRVLNSDILIADILRKAEKAIKPSGRHVEAKPPADIKQGGSVDPLDANVKKAFDRWMQTGSGADHLAYKKAKKAMKDGKT
jgi:hypothetical protein